MLRVSKKPICFFLLFEGARLLPSWRGIVHRKGRIYIKGRTPKKKGRFYRDKKKMKYRQIIINHKIVIFLKKHTISKLKYFFI